MGDFEIWYKMSLEDYSILVNLERNVCWWDLKY
jgi:hypothetical protein